jgi:hypothetical protein
METEWSFDSTSQKNINKHWQQYCKKEGKFLSRASRGRMALLTSGFISRLQTFNFWSVREQIFVILRL